MVQELRYRWDQAIPVNRLVYCLCMTIILCTCMSLCLCCSIILFSTFKIVTVGSSPANIWSTYLAKLNAMMLGRSRPNYLLTV